MALEFNSHRIDADSGKMEVAQERMFLTADRKRMVPEGHPDAASLYAAPGHRIPADVVERFGLKDGKLPASDPPKKAAPKPADKRRKGGADKGKG